MSFHAVIFDLDGTLLDTLDDIANSANRTLMRYGFPTHETSKYRYLIGDGVTMFMIRALPIENRDKATVEECVKTFREYYSHSWKLNTKPYEGIADLLDELTVRNIKLAVLSNKPDDFTKLCIHELLPKWKFGMVLGQREGVPPKPDPTAAYEISKALMIKPKDFLYLGDSGVDMKTATNAGMFPVGVKWGFRPPSELWENGARQVIDKPMDLLELIS